MMLCQSWHNITGGVSTCYRDSYVSKILYVETKESGPLGHAPYRSTNGSLNKSKASKTVGIVRVIPGAGVEST